jgi:thiol-disulfide isomerase/thioredoxin
MTTMKKYLPWTLRIIISALFMLSAVAKSFPIWAFEKQLVDLGLFSWCQAPYFSRLIIALEWAIALAMLQPYLLKRFVLPVTMLLLVAFNIHLGIQMVQQGAMNGNCGCFGQLIPMTPLEAFIKNILTLAALIYLYVKTKDPAYHLRQWLIMGFIYSVSVALMFMVFPFCPCAKSAKPIPPISLPSDTTVNTVTDSSNIISPSESDTTSSVNTLQQKQKKDSVPIKPQPKPTVSKFNSYRSFGGKTINLDQGKKILCLFVPGCDHCRDAAKVLAQLAKQKKIPEGYIIFMNEELFKIPEFYTETGIKFPYHVIDDIPEFFTLLGNNATTPGVYFLWNGNIIKSYEGTGERQFNAAELERIVASEKF